MSSPTAGAPRVELPALLSSAKLRLAPELQTARIRNNLIVVHNLADRRYLVVAQMQWGLLERFTQGATVPAVLYEIISENQCPPLREFYDLVTKAYEHGVLLVEGEPARPPVLPRRWWLSMPATGARFTAGLIIGVSLVVLVATRVQMPTRWSEVVIGLLVALLAGSLGQVFAACTLRGARCGVYRPRFDWKSPAPRFRVELREAVMGGRDTEIDVALVRLVPPILLAALAALKAPHYYLPLLGGVFVQLSPLWPTPLLDLLRALFCDPRLSTRAHFIFARSRPFALLAQARQQFSDRRFLLATTIATVVWLAAAFVTGCILFQANAVNVLHRFYTAGGLRYTGLVVVGALALIILGLAALALWIILGHAAAWLRERRARRRRLQVTGHSPEEVSELLSHVVLFRDLPPDTLRAVAVAMRPVEYRRGDYVIRMGDEADRIYVLVSGRLDVIRPAEDGRAVVVAEMSPGDVLGEIALVQGGTRTRSIRCATRCILFALAKADFERLVLAHVTRAEVQDAVQKVGFLQNTSLFRHWPQPSLAAFARLARFQEYSEGDMVVREGSDNLFLFLVYRGEFAVTQQGKLQRRLRQGDSYGEMGILQDQSTTASVTATLPGSCLVVSKADFLKFITQDFMISLRFERVGAKRTNRRGPNFNPIRA